MKANGVIQMLSKVVIPAFGCLLAKKETIISPSFLS